MRVLPEPLNSKYELQHQLGMGSFARVYQVRHRQTGALFALKVMDKAPLEAQKMVQQIHKEIAVLNRANGTPHVLRLREFVEAAGHFFLCFDLCGQNMSDTVSKQGHPFDEQAALHWLRAACVGVCGLHTRGIIHRDLKPENMLIDAKGSLQLCDLGLACFEDDGARGIAGTRQYAAPEMLDMRPDTHTFKADVYSLGASFQHFLLGRIPKDRNDLPIGLSENVRELLREMMRPDPKARISVEDLLQRLAPPEPEDDSFFGQLRSAVAMHLWGEETTKATEETLAPTPVTVAPSSKAPSLALAGPSIQLAAVPHCPVVGPLRHGVLDPHVSFAAPAVSMQMPAPVTTFGHRRVRSSP